MYNAVYTNKFKKDLKKLQKYGKGISKFKEVAVRLINGGKLDKKFKDHKLMGIYKDRRECHIEPDWLLIYKIDGTDIIFERMGSHSDLFK
jgi:mRNA interferase YafQ